MDVPNHISESIEALADMHVRAERQLSQHQRWIERLTGSLGQPRFLYAMISLASAWIAVNSLAPDLGAAAFDPPPFALLQGLTSLSALVIATMVLITQNHQSKLAEKRSSLDLQINLLAERKIAKVIALIEELRRDLPDVRDRLDAEANAMETRVDAHTVAEALEKSIDSVVRAEETGKREPEVAPSEDSG